jgi:hypothetical protein
MTLLLVRPPVMTLLSYRLPQTESLCVRIGLKRS